VAVRDATIDFAVRVVSKDVFECISTDIFEKNATTDVSLWSESKNVAVRNASKDVFWKNAHSNVFGKNAAKYVTVRDAFTGLSVCINKCVW